jgi:hypothetical protein
MTIKVRKVCLKIVGDKYLVISRGRADSYDLNRRTSQEIGSVC